MGSRLPSVSLRYTLMIHGFRHKGLQKFFETGSRAGIRPEHAPRLRLQLGRLDSASIPEDMNLPGWRFHKLEGSLEDHYAVTVNKNWRLTFSFEGRHANLVNYQDYH